MPIFDDLSRPSDWRRTQKLKAEHHPIFIPNIKKLENLFHYEVFKMLKAEGKITDYVAPQESLDGIAKVIYESKDGKTSIMDFTQISHVLNLESNLRLTFDIFQQESNVGLTPNHPPKMDTGSSDLRWHSLEDLYQ